MVMLTALYGKYHKQEEEFFFLWDYQQICSYKIKITCSIDRIFTMHTTFLRESSLTFQDFHIFKVLSPISLHVPKQEFISKDKQVFFSSSKAKVFTFFHRRFHSQPVKLTTNLA